MKFGKANKIGRDKKNELKYEILLYTSTRLECHMREKSAVWQLTTHAWACTYSNVLLSINITLPPRDALFQELINTSLLYSQYYCSDIIDHIQFRNFIAKKFCKTARSHLKHDDVWYTALYTCRSVTVDGQYLDRST